MRTREYRYLVIGVINPQSHGFAGNRAGCVELILWTKHSSGKEQYSGNQVLYSLRGEGIGFHPS